MKNKNTKAAKEEKQKNQEIDENISDERVTNAMMESNVDTSFFYTNDKFINQLDDIEIIYFIQKKYKDFNTNNVDSVIKKQLVKLIQDDVFVQKILTYFNITIFELFSILYKQFSFIFKGPYLKKLKKILSEKQYVTNERKQHDY